MNIFVWKAYGELRLLDADDLETMQNIFEEVTNILEGWHVDKIHDDIRHVEDIIAKDPQVKTYRGGIAALIAPHVGSHESFEHTTGFETVEQVHASNKL